MNFEEALAAARNGNTIEISNPSHFIIGSCEKDILLFFSGGELMITYKGSTVAAPMGEIPIKYIKLDWKIFDKQLFLAKKVREQSQQLCDTILKYCNTLHPDVDSEYFSDTNPCKLCLMGWNDGCRCIREKLGNIVAGLSDEKPELTGTLREGDD